MAAFVTVAILKTDYKKLEFEEKTSENVLIPASAPVAINLFDASGNLQKYRNAREPFELIFQIKVRGGFKPNSRLTGGSVRLPLFRTIETGRNRRSPGGGF